MAVCRVVRTMSQQPNMRKPHVLPAERIRRRKRLVRQQRANEQGSYKRTAVPCRCQSPCAQLYWRPCTCFVVVALSDSCTVSLRCSCLSFVTPTNDCYTNSTPSPFTISPNLIACTPASNTAASLSLETTMIIPMPMLKVLNISGSAIFPACGAEYKPVHPHPSALVTVPRCTASAAVGARLPSAATETKAESPSYPVVSCIASPLE